MAGQMIAPNPDRIRLLVVRQDTRPIHTFLHPIIEDRPVSSEMESDPMAQMKTARKVQQILDLAGAKTQILTCDGAYPAVYGEIKSDIEGAPTILLGGHYDGQPSEESRWEVTKPHEPKIVDLSGGERRVFGRGTSDDWGQVLTHIMAVQMIRESGAPLPVNLKFLIEGGEEVGSPNMDNLLEQNKELLACDLVILTDSAPGRMEAPVITTMARGYVGAIVRLNFGTNDSHSGKNLSYNAVEVLSKILSLKDLKTMRVEIPGFYGKVLELPDAVRVKLNNMPFDVELYRKHYGLPSIVTLEGCTPQETMWAQPSYEFHTVLNPNEKGFPKSNTIWTQALAFVSMRLVADQDPLEIFELFRQEVYRRLELHTNLKPEHLEITLKNYAYPFSQDVSGPMFRAVADGMKVGFNVSDVDFSGCGGTEPIAIYYQRILKVPVVFNAYNSPEDNYHGNDESISIERGFQPGIVANVMIYHNLYEVKKKRD